MTKFKFNCEGQSFETEKVTSGEATAQANQVLNVNERPVGVWTETARNEFTWTPHRS